MLRMYPRWVASAHFENEVRLGGGEVEGDIRPSNEVREGRHVRRAGEPIARDKDWNGAWGGERR